MSLQIRYVYNNYPQLYRVKHDLERGDVWRKGVPEVYVLDGTHRTYMKENIQYLTFNLLRAGAPNQSLADAKKFWRQLYDYRRAFSNKAVGFDGSGEPLADFINGWNLKSGLPAFDKTRVCGGASIAGYEDGKWLVVETINAEAPLFDVEEILAKPWLYFHATTVRSDGTIGRFPQGGGEPVFVPLISRHSLGPVRYPLEFLEKLPIGEVADPYKV